MTVKKLETLCKHPYLHMMQRDNWAFVHRPNSNGAAIIVALTPDNEIILVEQYRSSFDKNVIELPAGLIGDQDKYEKPIEAAQRELLEETGYKALDMKELFPSSVSSGLADEIMIIFLARKTIKIDEGGGVDGENIKVHIVKLDQVHNKLQDFIKKGLVIDLKIYAALWLIDNLA